MHIAKIDPIRVECINRLDFIEELEKTSKELTEHTHSK